MYRRPKFLEILLAIREEMAREADYDTDLFAEMVRADLRPAVLRTHELTEAKPEGETERPGRRRASS
jgi:hypothetical protein